MVMNTGPLPDPSIYHLKFGHQCQNSSDKILAHNLFLFQYNLIIPRNWNVYTFLHVDAHKCHVVRLRVIKFTTRVYLAILETLDIVPQFGHKINLKSTLCICNFFSVNGEWPFKGILQSRISVLVLHYEEFSSWNLIGIQNVCGLEIVLRKFAVRIPF